MTFLFLHISPSAHFDSAVTVLFYCFDIFHSNFSCWCRFSWWAVLITRSAKGLFYQPWTEPQQVKLVKVSDFERKGNHEQYICLYLFFPDFQAEGENEVNNELANRISLFYADATPMLKTLSDGTTKFVSEVRLQHLTATLAFKMF